MKPGLFNTFEMGAKFILAWQVWKLISEHFLGHLRAPVCNSDFSWLCWYNIYCSNCLKCLGCLLIKQIIWIINSHLLKVNHVFQQNDQQMREQCETTNTFEVAEISSCAFSIKETSIMAWFVFFNICVVYCVNKQM